MNRWLVDQLPSVMSNNHVIYAFAGAAEEIGDSFRERADGVEQELDAHLASVEMLAYMASWLGYPLETTDGADFNRSVLPVFGRVLRNRGTAIAIRDLLEALTGGPVQVWDSGGIYGPGDIVPPHEPVVGIQLASVGVLGSERLLAILNRELPVGVHVDVTSPSALGSESSSPREH